MMGIKIDGKRHGLRKSPAVIEKSKRAEHPISEI